VTVFRKRLEILHGNHWTGNNESVRELRYRAPARVPFPRWQKAPSSPREMGIDGPCAIFSANTFTVIPVAWRVDLIDDAKRKRVFRVNHVARVKQLRRLSLAQPTAEGKYVPP